MIKFQPYGERCDVSSGWELHSEDEGRKGAFRPAGVCSRERPPSSARMSYANGMDHLDVLREKIGRLRVEIAHIQGLNEQYRLRDGNGTEAQVAHGQRHERLQEIQQELVQLSNLGHKAVSIEQMREKHRSRLHLVKQAS
jgi:hypothetical protein